VLRLLAQQWTHTEANRLLGSFFRRLNTVLGLTPNLSATTVALPSNGSGSTYHFARPFTVKHPSAADTWR
jgi:hypothetical protein